MASFGGIHVYDSALRQPARAAHDSMSCAITRGSVTNDTSKTNALLTSHNIVFVFVSHLLRTDYRLGVFLEH